MFRNGDPHSAGEIIGSQRILRAQNFRDRSLRDNLAAARSCPWAKIKNMIGGSDRFFVVLDHDHGIAEIAKFSECSQKSSIVALMQSDARLVQNIKNTGQSRSNLRCKADALRFTAGKRAALAI